MSVQLSLPGSSAPHGGQFNEFPLELLEHVALCLSPREIARTQSVARNWTLSQRHLSEILITRIKSKCGRISTYDLQASVALLGGQYSHHAKALINLIKTLEFMTSHPCHHLDLYIALLLEELEFSPDTRDDNICIAPVLPWIRKLNFSHCNQLTDSGFLKILARYPNTHSLNFCPLVTNKGLALAAESFHRNLRTIQLISSSQFITDNGLMSIAFICPNLMQLHFETPFGYISDASIIQIANHCHLLRKLHLAFPFITDRSLIAIPGGCPQLKELHLEDLRKEISKEGILALINGCPELSKLSLKNVPKITAEDVAEIASQCQHSRLYLI